VTQKGTDRRTWLYRLGCWRWSRIYTLYGVCHASRVRPHKAWSASEAKSI